MAAPHPSQQLELHGFTATHPRPYAARGDRIARRMAPAAAWERPFIQVNPEHQIAVDLHDCDNPLTLGRFFDGPAPSWTVTNARTRHAHVSYVLTDPVARHDGARLKPWAFYCDVHAGLTVRLGGDPAYAGLLTRNPLAPGDGCYTTWGRLAAYSLAELRDWCPETLPDRTVTAEGRNCELFSWAVSHAHRPAQARALQGDREGARASWWRDLVATENVRRFGANALPMIEVRSIAASSAGYAVRQYSEAAFSDRQRLRGLRSGRARRDRNQARDVGIVVAHRHGQGTSELAERAGVSQRHVRRIIAAARAERT